MKYAQDTICAIATGNAIGAIAVIRLSGPKSLEILQKSFSKDLSKEESHTLHFGLFKNEEGVLIDEVLVSVFQVGKSFTGEESIEISCHSSPYIQQQIIETLLANGCRMAEAGEFTMRAYLNGKMDLSQAEAVADLIASQSQLAHDMALKQMRGGFSNELKELREKLIHFASLVELELDFAEEDVEFADRRELLALVQEVKVYIQKLISSFRLGNAIKKGVPVAFVGRPNAGKSTVLNALLNEERAIVSDIPGTTRDTIEEVITHKGISFRLMDTAGIHLTEDVIEKKGIEKSLQKMEEATLVIYLFDCTTFTQERIHSDKANFLKQNKHLLVATKGDLANESNLKDLKELSKSEGEEIQLVTIQKQSDRNMLMDLIFDHSVGNEIQQHHLIVSNARHVDKLSKAEESLDKAEWGLTENISADLVAMDIRQAMYQIGQITGDISTDDLLGNIFAKFCIGK